MEKSYKIPQLYAYAICLIAVVTFLVSITEVVTAFIDKGDPLHSNSYTLDEDLASFEVYKMSILSRSKTRTGENISDYTPNDEELKAMYDAIIKDKTITVNHKIKKTFIVDGILISLCLLLFFTHWFWIRGLTKK